jgi:hypothetical protein
VTTAPPAQAAEELADVPEEQVGASWVAQWLPRGYSFQMRLHAPAEAVAQRVPPGAAGYSSQAADWTLLRLKVMSRVARLAPLSATTPVACSPRMAQIRLS